MLCLPVAANNNSDSAKSQLLTAIWPHLSSTFSLMSSGVPIFGHRGHPGDVTPNFGPQDPSHQGRPKGQRTPAYNCAQGEHPSAVASSDRRGFRSKTSVAASTSGTYKCHCARAGGTHAELTGVHLSIAR